MLRKNASALLATGFSLLVLAAVFGGLAYRADLEVLLEVWARMDPWWMVAAVLAMELTVFVSTIRFQSIIAADTAARIPLPSLWRIQLIGLFVAHGAPISAIGDLAKAGLMKLRFEINLASSIRLVIYDRAIGLMVLLVFGALNTILQFVLGVRGNILVFQAILFTGGLSVFIMIASFSTVPFLPRWKSVRKVIAAVQGLGKLLMRWKFGIRQMAIGLSLLLGVVLVFWTLSIGMRIEIDPVLIALFVPFIMLVNNLPFFYLGWGGREVAIMATLGTTGGVNSVEALALSIAFGGVFLLTALPGGILWLLRPTLRKETKATVNSGINV